MECSIHFSRNPWFRQWWWKNQENCWKRNLKMWKKKIYFEIPFPTTFLISSSSLPKSRTSGEMDRGLYKIDCNGNTYLQYDELDLDKSWKSWQKTHTALASTPWTPLIGIFTACNSMKCSVHFSRSSWFRQWWRRNQKNCWKRNLKIWKQDRKWWFDPAPSQYKLKQHSWKVRISPTINISSNTELYFHKIW